MNITPPPLTLHFGEVYKQRPAGQSEIFTSFGTRQQERLYATDYSEGGDAARLIAANKKLEEANTKDVGRDSLIRSEEAREASAELEKLRRELTTKAQ